jgi:hypothetical protein
VRRRGVRPAPRNPFRPCSLCFQGLQLVEVVRDGRRERESRRCDCLKALACGAEGDGRSTAGKTSSGPGLIF